MVSESEPAPLHAFMDEYSTCYWCHEVTYRDVYGWFGDDPDGQWAGVRCSGSEHPALRR